MSGEAGEVSSRVAALPAERVIAFAETASPRHVRSEVERGGRGTRLRVAALPVEGGAGIRRNCEC
jgi:hypothetical protein